MSSARVYVAKMYHGAGAPITVWLSRATGEWRGTPAHKGAPLDTVRLRPHDHAGENGFLFFADSDTPTLRWFADVLHIVASSEVGPKQVEVTNVNQG